MTSTNNPRNTGLGRAFEGIAVDRRKQRSSPASDIDVSFFVTRHGESWGQINLNAYKTPGDAAIPLTDWGVQQSFEGGLFLEEYADIHDIEGFEIYTSTCLRTRQTGNHIARGLGEERITSVNEDSRLDKQLFGIFSGIFDDAEKARLYPVEFADYQRQISEVGLFHARPFGGESIADVQRKASDFVQSILRTSTPGKRRNIKIVTHGLVALCIENELMKHGEDWVLANIDRGANLGTKLLEPKSDGYTATEIGRGVKRPKLALPTQELTVAPA